MRALGSQPDETMRVIRDLACQRRKIGQFGRPLELSVDGRNVDWYDVDALDGLTDIDLLLVDGAITPAASDPLTPALHVLGRRLSPAAAVVVDDEPNRVAPRQGGGFGLTVRHRLPGRWTALTHPQATAVSRTG